MRFYVSWLLIFFLATPFAIAKDQENPKPQTADATSEVVAKVNGVEIKRTDFNDELNRFVQKNAQGQRLEGEQLDQAKQTVLKMLIGKELLYQASQKKKIQADTAEIDKQIDAIKKRYKDDAAFEQALGKAGITEAGLRAMIQKTNMIRQLLETDIVSQVKVDEAESKAFYDEHPDNFKQQEQVRARHILVKVDPGEDTAKARTKIEKIQAELKAGGDFAELAKTNSDGPSKVNGGDLGYFRRGQMVPPFEKAAFALEPGEISDIVETRFGYHLIKLEDKKPGGTLSYEEVKDDLQKQLKDRKIQEKIETYVQELTTQADIEHVAPL